MYTKSFTYKDMNGNRRTDKVNFHLFEREVFKLLVPLQALMLMSDQLSKGGGEDGDELRELETSEVVEFYTLFEEILIKAYGNVVEDGAGFSHDGWVQFEESCLFNACMMEFVSNPKEVQVLLEKIMPDGLQEVVRNADANMLALSQEENSSPELQAKIAKLRAELTAAENANKSSDSTE